MLLATACRPSFRPITFTPIIRLSFSTSHSLSIMTTRSSNQHNYQPKAGFDDSGSSGLYNKARPDYPAEAISAILNSPTSTSSSTGLNVVELGSGTGICSRLLINPPHSTSSASIPKVSRLLAFEPSKGMRVGFEKNVLGDESVEKVVEEKGIQVKCQDGTFEAFDAGNDNDLVVIAQAWHWCPDFNKALSSISKSLKPGGVLALIWNLEDREAAPWVGKLRDLYEVYEDGTPQYRHNYWHAMYTTPSISEFSALESQHFHRELPTTLSGVTDRVLSKSFVSLLSDQDKAKVTDGIEELLGGEKGESLNEEQEKALGRKWLKKEEGLWNYPYRTDLYLFQKK